ncbi:MAG TPA: hypothetical protein VIE44_00705 [Methylomirabilota bacterium]
MSLERAECALCKDVTVPLKGGGSVRWERQDTPDLHYMATAPAMRRRQWASEERVAGLRGQIDAIHAKGRVAWVDVKESGEFALYHAPHGAVPGNIPRTPR